MAIKQSMVLNPNKAVQVSWHTESGGSSRLHQEKGTQKLMNAHYRESVCVYWFVIETDQC